MPSGGPGVVGHLEWFPKRVAEGDMRATSEMRLLQGDLDPTEVIVRELAQNAWDARDGSGAPVDFGLELRRLDKRTRTHMAHLLSGPPDDSLGLRSWLLEGDGAVLEVTDRGTTGLRGPVRTDLQIPEGQPTNFIDFVYSVGATKPAGGDTGGTYGFGKSAAYAFSRVGTVIIWTRVRAEQGHLEDRLIVSAIGEPFDHLGRRHTGRHWWGAVFEQRGERRIEPLVGPTAAATARAWFARGFEPGETGTSLLLLAPKVEEGLSPGRTWGLHALHAMTQHLWPKAVPEDDASAPPMDIHVTVDGARKRLVDHLGGPVVSAYQRCLSAVRRPDEEPPSGVTLRPLKHGKVAGAVADVAFTRALGSGGSVAGDPLGGVTDRVACMRRGAQLVVCYDNPRPAANESLPWVGVMMPRQPYDGDFAEAEPAAHDRWYPGQVEDRHRASVVRVTLRRLKEAVDRYLEVAQRTPRTDRTPAARLGDDLGSLVSGLAGAAPRPSVGAGGRTRESAGSGEHLVAVPGTPSTRIEGKTFKIIVPVALSRTAERSCAVRAVVRAAVDQDRSIEDPRIEVLGWQVRQGLVHGPLLAVAAGASGEVARLLLRTTTDVVPDLTLRIEETA